MKASLFGIIALLVLAVSVPSAFAQSAGEESESPIKIVLDLTRENMIESLDSTGEVPSTAQAFYDLGQEEYEKAIDALENGDEEAAAGYAISAMELYEDSAEVIGEIQESFVSEGFGDIIDNGGIPSGITEQFTTANIFEVQEEITELGLEFEELKELAGSNDVNLDFDEFEESINAAKEDLASGDASNARDQLKSIDDFKEEVFEKINEKISEEQEARVEEFGEQLAEKIEDVIEQDLVDDESIEQMQETLEVLQTGDIEDILESTSEDSEFAKEVEENEIEEELGDDGPGNSENAPGQDNDDSGPGNSENAPGQDNDDSGPGNSENAPGQDNDDSGPGNSENAPEQDNDDSGVDDSGVDDSGVDDSGVDDSGVDDSGVDDSGVDDSGVDESFEEGGVDESFEDNFEDTIDDSFEDNVEETADDVVEAAEEAAEEGSSVQKTSICHNGDQTLSLPDSAISAHQAHGDVLGACVIDGVTIGTNANIGNNFSAEDGVVIGNDVTIGNNADIKRDVVIGNNANIGNSATIEYEVVIGNDFTATGNQLKIEEQIVIGNDVTITGSKVTIKKESTSIGNDVTITGSNVDVSESMLVVCHSGVTTSIDTSDQSTHVPDHPGDTLGVCVNQTPVISDSIGNESQTENDVYSVSGFSATDVQDDDTVLTNSIAIQITSPVSSTVIDKVGSDQPFDITLDEVGDWIITVDVTDSDTNAATQVTRTVTVNSAGCSNGGPIISGGANIDPSATIGACAIIENNVKIEKNVVIGDNVTVEKNTEILEGAIIHNNVYIEQGVKIEKNVIVNIGATIEKNLTMFEGSTITSGTTITSDCPVGNTCP